MRIAILWTELSGYLNACLKELAGRDGVELFVAHEAPQKSSPFDENQFKWITNRLTWNTSCDPALLERQLRAFTPDIIVFCSWHVPTYRRVARNFANKCWRVMAMDHGWLGTLRQRIGTWVAPYYLHPLTDAVWLPGEPQATFARKLGFQDSVILRGLYACDEPVFGSAHLARVQQGRPVPHSFLFLGRFAREKGLDTLARAYQAYREANPDPWPLVCCGSGPFQFYLEGKAGIDIKGFVQPKHLPGILASSGCLILPSLFEPWAVAVHEAAAAGLLILASERVGAAVHLVQPNYNGFIFGCGDVEALAGLMSRVSAMSDSHLNAMSRASHLLSQQFSPSRWADILLESFSALNQHRAQR